MKARNCVMLHDVVIVCGPYKAIPASQTFLGVRHAHGHALAGTRDEPPRTSAWEARSYHALIMRPSAPIET